MTSRTRTRGLLSGGTQNFKTTTFGGSVTNQELTSRGLIIGESQTTTDVVTPNFRTRIERGEIINNPFESWTVNQTETFSGHAIRRTSGSGSTIRDYEWSKGYSIPEPRTDWWVDIHKNLVEASTEAAAGVEKTTVDGDTELGEARETIEMFHLRNYDLRQQIDREIKYALKKGYKFPARSAIPVKVLANNWLMYRYGIGPLLRLLNDTLVVGSRIRTRRETSRGGSLAGGTDSQTYPVISGSFHDVTHTVSKSWESSIRAGILYEYWGSFGNAYGLNVENISSAAWELIPYSFVADWFANTGSYIRALTPRFRTVRRATWVGYHTKLFYSSYTSLSSLKPAGYTVVKNQSGAFVHKIEGRKRVPQILGPEWYIRENAISQIIDSRRIVDAFALTTQQFFKLMCRSR